MSIQRAITLTFWLLFSVSCTFACVRSVNDWMIVGRWAGAAVCLLPLFLCTAVCSYGSGKIPSRSDSGKPDGITGLVFTPAAQSLAVCNIAVTVYGGLQWLGVLAPVGTFRITAGFDNPAGMAAALTSTFPFLVYALSGCKRLLPVCTYLFLAESALLYAAGTRAGLIAMTVAFGLSLWPRLSCRGRNAMLAALALCLTAALVIMFCRKEASTYGRSLILRCSLSLAMEHPLLGAGPGGFRRLYMPYQAEWLSSPAYSGASLLADNVGHPLCEYVLVLVNYGIVGLTVVLSLLAATVVRSLRMKAPEGRASAAVLSAVAVLSAFSYPFRYPLTSAVVLVACFTVWAGAIDRLPARIARALPAVAAAAYGLVLAFLLIPWLRAQADWRKVSDRSGNEDFSEPVLAEYRRLESSLGRDPYFLYNQAVTYHQAGRDVEALQYIRSSLAIMSCYDSVLLRGDIERNLGLGAEAESSYRLASGMCPCRFIPLYRLFRMYQDAGRDSEMRSVGQEILSKPMKVPSAEVRRIRLSVRQALAGLVLTSD